MVRSFIISVVKLCVVISGAVVLSVMQLYGA